MPLQFKEAARLTMGRGQRMTKEQHAHQKTIEKGDADSPASHNLSGPRLNTPLNDDTSTHPGQCKHNYQESINAVFPIMPRNSHASGKQFLAIPDCNISLYSSGLAAELIARKSREIKSLHSAPTTRCLMANPFSVATILDGHTTQKVTCAMETQDK